MDCPRHSVAWQTALSIMSVFEDCVPEGEHKDAMHRVYLRLIAALEGYDVHVQWRWHQTEPSEN